MRVQKATDGAIGLSRASDEAAGFDLHAIDSVDIYPGDSRLVRTGVAIELPRGSVGLICPRSGLAAKYGVTVLNGPGVIDEDYRGEIGILLHNTGDRVFRIAVGDRIAQMVIVPYLSPPIEYVDTLSGTDRGDGGFGSTGR